MWGTFSALAEKAKATAVDLDKKAKEAAANLDRQLDQTLGMEGAGGSGHQSSSSALGLGAATSLFPRAGDALSDDALSDDALNDAWGDDDDLDNLNEPSENNDDEKQGASDFVNHQEKDPETDAVPSPSIAAMIEESPPPRIPPPQPPKPSADPAAMDDENDQAGDGSGSGWDDENFEEVDMSQNQEPQQQQQQQQQQQTEPDTPPLQETETAEAAVVPVTEESSPEEDNGEETNTDREEQGEHHLQQEEAAGDREAKVNQPPDGGDHLGSTDIPGSNHHHHIPPPSSELLSEHQEEDQEDCQKDESAPKDNDKLPIDDEQDTFQAGTFDSAASVDVVQEQPQPQTECEPSETSIEEVAVVEPTDDEPSSPPLQIQPPSEEEDREEEGEDEIVDTSGAGWVEDGDLDLTDTNATETEDEVVVAQAVEPVVVVAAAAAAVISEETPPPSSPAAQSEGKPETSHEEQEEALSMQAIPDLSTERPTAIESSADVTEEQELPNHVIAESSPPESTPATSSLPPPPLPPDAIVEETQQQLSHQKLQEQLSSQQEITRILEQRLDELQGQLQQREVQLLSKTEQLTTIQSMHESEKGELQQKIQMTKDEAKKRIHKAKERVEAMEAKFKSVAAAQGSSADDAVHQAEMIAELRAEGENLARKQADMEKAVRSAKGEARELREKLEDESLARNDALTKVAQLESQLKETKDSLAGARRGESQAGKLEEDLRQAREDAERKGSTILSLEQQTKELKAQMRELLEELESTTKGAAVETQREQQKLRREHNEMISDLENRLRIGEREAAVREDALRLEVDELRKRWQDAVRRADALSMDMQSSTAPLLRQLESAERQNRARAAAAAEVETKLRGDLEDSIMANERLTKERSEWKTKFNRLERKAKEDEDELKSTKLSLEEKKTMVEQLEEKLQRMETDGAKMKEEWAEVERLANEGVARVRSEMTQTVVESEERYRSQLDTMQAELRKEQEKRRQLEAQVDELLENAGMIVPPTAAVEPVHAREARPKRLQRSQGQEEILAVALGLGDMGDDEEEDDDEDDEEGGGGAQQSSSGTNSFAALEELSSRLKAAKVELNALRRSLDESETTRDRLAGELGEERNAREKLPLFETKVRELTAENEEQALEIQALQEDISEVRDLYRSQLNILLEERAKAENGSPDLNGEAPESSVEEEAADNKLD